MTLMALEDFTSHFTNGGEYFTVKALRDALKDLPDLMWVCVDSTPGGPMRALFIEAGASEQFCLIETENLKV
jgi:hypothetical protein